MKLGIAVRGYSKPSFLRATLDSIFNQDIGDVVVGVYLDKDISTTIRKEIFTCLGNFDISKVLNSSTCIGNTYTYLWALSDMFQVEGCDPVMVLEEGNILDVNTVSYVRSLEMFATIYALDVRAGIEKNSWLQNFILPGFVISKSSFEYFKRWFEAKLYLSHIWIPDDLDKDKKRLWELDFTPVAYIFERLIQVYLSVHGGICKFPDKSYIYTLE